MTTTASRVSRVVVEAGALVNPIEFDQLVESSSHILVYADDDQLSVGTHYSVSGIGDDAGAEITLTDAAIAMDPDKWVVVHRPTIDQDSDLSAGGAFGLAYERGLDALTRRMQSIYSELMRSVRLHVDTVDVAPSLPVSAPGKLIGWDDDGINLANLEYMNQEALVAAAVQALAALFGQDGFVEGVNTMTSGVIPGADAAVVTAAAQAMYDSAGLLRGNTVVWTPGIYDVDGTIFQRYDNIRTVLMPGVVIRQHKYGWPVIATADPDDESVRPNGVSFTGSGGARFENWIDGELAYYHHAFLGVSEAGPFAVGASTSSTADNLFVFRNNTLLIKDTDYTVTGFGTEELTITLVVPNSSTEYIVAKVTNKWDRYSHPTESLFGDTVGNRANECTPIWHGGGDDFLVEGIHVEGFVAIVSVKGDWTSDGPNVHSRNVTIRDCTFNNCEYVLVQQCRGVRVERIAGGVISETQTGDGLRNIYNPAGLLSPTFKDPHVCYVTNGGDSSTENLLMADLTGDNKYSSNYKVRNAVGVTIRASAITDYLRAIDLDGVTNVTLDMPMVKGSFATLADSQRAALNLSGVHDATIKVGTLECIGDIIRAIRMDTGRTPASSVRRICKNIRVEVGNLYTSGTAARSNDWIVDSGGEDCYVKIGKVTQAGADTGHIFRVRSSQDASFAYAGALRGGIEIGEIHLVDARTLKVARLTVEDAVTPTDITVRFDKARVTGAAATYHADTVIDAGTNTQLEYGGKGVDVISTDAPFTLTPILSNWDVLHDGTLTGNRQCDLSTADAREGDCFCITRTGGGAFNLNVGTGPLKALTTGTYGKFKFNGTAWYLAEYGAL